MEVEYEVLEVKRRRQKEGQNTRKQSSASTKDERTTRKSQGMQGQLSNQRLPQNQINDTTDQNAPTSFLHGSKDKEKDRL